MGVVHVYTRELADAVLELVASGENLRAICALPGMPSRSTVRNWAQDDHDGFGARYTMARKAAAQHWDEMAEQVLLDAKDKDQIARARELAQHWRWRASKAAPREYGDRLEVEHSGTVNVAAELSVARQRRALLDASAQPVTLDAVPDAQLVEP